MCSQRSWGSAGMCWPCFLARDAEDTEGVTVTLFRNAFLVGVFNDSSEISELSQGQLWRRYPFPIMSF